MTDSLWLENLAVYSLQIGMLVGLGGMLPALVRMRAAAARLVYWHILLVACLALPVIRPWRQQVIAVPLPAVADDMPVSTAPMTPVAHEIPWRAALLWLFAAGAVVRLGSLGAGLWRLRRYRLDSQPLDTAYDADIRMSNEVSSPVTFGARRPVILVPARFTDLAASMQRAILCHELLHIERRDWLFTMAEELVRAVFWFHPAIWWVLGEVQLAREQAVDRRVVELTAARDLYVDALLAMAGARPQLDLAPAPLFLRKRHLKHRVVEILKEANMSRQRLISALAASLAILAAGCWFVTGVFPLAGAPQIVADAPGVSVNLNGVQLMHRSAVAYPSAAMANNIQGTVVVQVKLDSNGEVADASVLSGPDELRKAVIQSVLNWHFTKDEASSARTLSVDFALQKPQPPDSAAVQPSANAGARSDKLTNEYAAKVAAKALDGRLGSISVEGLSDEARDEMLAKLPVHVGDQVDLSRMREVMAVVKAFDPHLMVSVSPADGGGGRTLHIALPGTPPRAVPGTVLYNSAGPTQPPQRIRVGGNIQAQNVVSQVRPVYPPAAKEAHITGQVELEAIIGKDGHVMDLKVVSGHPLLVQAALDAVKDWVYKPTLLNGEPVEVASTIDINFTLAQ